MKEVIGRALEAAASATLIGAIVALISLMLWTLIALFNAALQPALRGTNGSLLSYGIVGLWVVLFIYYLLRSDGSDYD